MTMVTAFSIRRVCYRFVVLVCGTLVYSRGDEVQNAKAHAELQAAAEEEGQAALPGLPTPGKA